MRAKWLQGQVIKIKNESPTTKRFWVEVSETTFDFIPGQFIVMDLPIGKKRLHRWRSYSIANVPDDTNIIELCIVHLPGGAASKYFWETVQPGTLLKFKEPEGTFTTPNDLLRTNVMIATGTGIAPFRSMLLDIRHRQIKHNTIHLIFGTRTPDGLLYKDDFIKWAQNNLNFNYSVALSRATLEDIDQLKEHNIDAHLGYVHDVYLEPYHRHPDAHFYICGWSAMIDDAVANLLLKMKIPKERIHYELYGDSIPSDK